MDPDDLASPERLEQIRRSLVMLTPGQPAWLTREDAIVIVERLVELQSWALRRSCCHDEGGC